MWNCTQLILHNGIFAHITDGSNCHTCCSRQALARRLGKDSSGSAPMLLPDTWAMPVPDPSAPTKLTALLNTRSLWVEMAEFDTFDFVRDADGGELTVLRAPRLGSPCRFVTRTFQSHRRKACFLARSATNTKKCLSCRHASIHSAAMLGCSFKNDLFRQMFLTTECVRWCAKRAP